MFVFLKVSLLFCKWECMVSFEEGEFILSSFFNDISGEYLYVLMLLFFFIVLFCIIYENVYVLNYFFYL